MSTGGGSRIAAVQVLRAVAATSVAVSHLAFGFADHVGEGLGIGEDSGLVAQAAVALFFLVSGYIMVVSPARLFGTPGGTRQFWWRRAVRILPPYWLATVLLAAILLWHGQAVAWGDLARSLVLWPYFSAAGGQPLPVLWPGWTLFYEAVFYILFGIGVSASRGRSVAIAAAAIGLAVMAGLWLVPQSALGFSLTRPISLLFVAGMGWALWQRRGVVLPAALRWVLLGLGLALLVDASAPAGVEQLGFVWLGWAGLPALALFLAALGGPLRPPLADTVELLGSASYALYLLHVPMGWLWNSAYPGALYALGAWFYLATLLAGTFAVSIAFHLWLERPLTRRLNAVCATG